MLGFGDNNFVPPLPASRAVCASFNVGCTLVMVLWLWHVCWDHAWTMMKHVSGGGGGGGIKLIVDGLEFCLLGYELCLRLDGA